MSAFSTLRRLARKPEVLERCDLCGTTLYPGHQHLVEPAAHKLICSCDACALLFYSDGETKYRRVPRQGRLLCDFQMSDSQWDSLLIPIGLAYFLSSSTEKRVLAMYPSPAGATESLLTLEAWNGIVDENPVLRSLTPDVEALLVNRLDRPGKYFIAPIDQCLELTGIIRANWRGLSGGSEVWGKIGAFFERLEAGSRCPA